MSAATAIVPSTSFRSRTFDPVWARDAADADGGLDVRGDENDAHQQEEHSVPVGAEDDEGEGEEEGERVEDEDDPRSRAEVRLEDLAGLDAEPAEAGLDVEGDPDQEEADQRRRDLGDVQQEVVRDLLHRFTPSPGRRRRRA
jgi:hypothetical protein